MALLQHFLAAANSEINQASQKKSSPRLSNTLHVHCSRIQCLCQATVVCLDVREEAWVTSTLGLLCLSNHLILMAMLSNLPLCWYNKTNSVWITAFTL